MLESKETEQFDTRYLTRVVVVVSGIPRKKKQNGFVSEVKCFALKIP